MHKKKRRWLLDEKKAKPNEIPVVRIKRCEAKISQGKVIGRRLWGYQKKNLFFPLSAYMNKVATRSEEYNMFLGQIGLTHVEKKRREQNKNKNKKAKKFAAFMNAKRP